MYHFGFRRLTARSLFVRQEELCTRVREGEIHDLYVLHSATAWFPGVTRASEVQQAIRLCQDKWHGLQSRFASSNRRDDRQSARGCHIHTRQHTRLSGRVQWPLKNGLEREEGCVHVCMCACTSNLGRSAIRPLGPRSR